MLMRIELHMNLDTNTLLLSTARFLSIGILLIICNGLLVSEQIMDRFDQFGARRLAWFTL